MEILVKSTIALRHTRLTWPRPCGVEIVQAPSLDDEDDRGAPQGAANSEARFASIEARDDATHFFIERWPAGEHRIKLLVRAEVAGVVQAPPVELEPMYGNAPPTSAKGPRTWRIVEEK